MNKEKLHSLTEKEHLPNVEVVTGVLNEELIEVESTLQTPFDLVVASSVFAFLDDYSETLGILKRLLSDHGVLVQWDWKKTEKNPDFGFTTEDLEKGYRQTDLTTLSNSEPFGLESEQGRMTVIMGAARNGS